MHDPDCIFCAGEARRAHLVTAGLCNRHAIELAEEKRALKDELAAAREEAGRLREAIKRGRPALVDAPVYTAPPNTVGFAIRHKAPALVFENVEDRDALLSTKEAPDE